MNWTQRERERETAEASQEQCVLGQQINGDAFLEAAEKSKQMSGAEESNKGAQSRSATQTDEHAQALQQLGTKRYGRFSGRF